ncbi:hypothetical protein D9Q81_08095 [Candidatus Korarchaeum cryptofilum]|uniref:Oligopeptide/dipeptide ABC transporter C-terminal domain-containing protein n=1 Tax=Candidatus Korarchaeum cryptofilum TaxID=498846 RepID=A0A429G1Q9_9CREN|nr:oligopeptide/dipeptide ABC transporter ATP-binding protein [Candidatus Korarchaeum cryptofilum]RSN67743.1 hypothetical protein D9Q81_08095 [Candidatus Korarchaeum cryptofilum]
MVLGYRYERYSCSRIILPGEPPSPVNPPPGCKLATRCPYAMELCMSREPELVDIGGGHLVRCWQLTSLK